MNEPFILFENVEKIYRMGEVEIRAVNGADFTIDRGEFTVIVGPSGAGKTTILNMLGGMDNCTSGKIIVDDREVSNSTARKLTGKQILALLQKTCRDREMTVIVITHNLALTPMADKVIHIRNGKVEKIEINNQPLPVEQIEW